MTLIERFLKYVSFDTQSDDNSGVTPSTPKQMVFAQYLRSELEQLGFEEISLDENGYLFATLPANTDKPVPTIGFIAHMDTSPDMTGAGVTPRIVYGYDGSDIVLCEEENVVLSPNRFPELLDHKGEDLIVTNGKTLLGADDKAGIAEIITAMVYLKEHPEIKHGKIRVGFNPDEEIGLGAHKFDVEKFGCEWAYTMDGGEVGELEFENFNAASAKVVVKGRNVHPGYAKNKMINSMCVANQFMNLLPDGETPQCTLNGKKVSTEIAADTVLLNLLRDLGCKSVKCGCETTNCGLCTVWIDGKSRLSCSVLAASIDGHEVTTLEGVEKEAAEFGSFLAQEGAEQCGFCSPGFIMNVLAMFRELKNPSIEEIKEYLAGNLCRCTGYMGQLRAIQKYMEVRNTAVNITVRK